jgi:uncharacterized protein
MRNMKRLLSLVLVGLLVLSFTSCEKKADPAASAEPAAVAEAAPEIKQISIAGAGSAGTFYIMATGFAELINQKLGINSVGEVTAGSVENANLIHSKQVEFGVMQLDVAQNARKGVAPFDGPKELVAVTPMYPNLVQIIVLKDSPIKSFADLKGKRVSVGSPGSGILATNTVILETLGLTLADIKPLYLSFAETTTAFRDGACDAVIVNTAAPAPFLVDLETTHPLKAVPLTNDQIKAFTDKFSFYVPATLPANAYRTITTDTPTFATWIALMTYPELSESVVYSVVKTIHENGAFLKDVHVVSQFVTLENVPSITGVPYHPGAARYYAERGVKVSTN